jgi:hypothetical protein
VTHHAQPLDLFNLALGVGDEPVPGDQLRGQFASIDDGDGVGEAIDALFGRRLVRQVFGPDFYA